MRRIQRWLARKLGVAEEWAAWEKRHTMTDFYGTPITAAVTEEMIDAAVNTLAANAIRRNHGMSDYGFRINVARMIGEALAAQARAGGQSDYATFARVLRQSRQRPPLTAPPST